MCVCKTPTRVEFVSEGATYTVENPFYIYYTFSHLFIVYEWCVCIIGFIFLPFINILLYIALILLITSFEKKERNMALFGRTLLCLHFYYYLSLYYMSSSQYILSSISSSSFRKNNCCV